ncbi:hypothetical protein [Phenylobacterium aquaticum]|uniref:hypothetical protein n=1 Tax=Phenylobacterium aquaticum TaxID=1763816 RepID=UPI0026EB7F02|nr:hypothetical protein [Phenylobacterium aquaticum]
MSNIVPFTPRPPDGDWTSGERARLGELADRLATGGARVKAAYGVSDEGDPWCVIQDEDDEVLIHIARIGGGFVIHDATRDAVGEEDSLWSAMARLLGKAWRDGSTVIPLDARKAQALLALIMAAVFVQEAMREGQLVATHPGGDPAHDPHLPPPDEAVGGSQEHHPAAELPPHDPALVARTPDQEPSWHGWDRPGSQPETGPQAPPTGAVAALALPALAQASLAQAATPTHAEIAGLAPTTTPATGHLSDGPTQLALLNTRGGPDRIEVAAGMVARGGPGSDNFVLTGKTAGPPGFTAQIDGANLAARTTSDGVILNFGAGDHLVFANGAAAVIVSVTATSDVLSGLHGAGDVGRLGETPGVRVGVDLDGDGHEDIFVLVAGSGVSSLTPTHSSPPAATGAASSQAGPTPVVLEPVVHHEILLG